jgi:UDP-N-acetylmuramyl pentapeptide synthase
MTTLGKNKVFVNDHDVVEIQVIGDQTLKSIRAMATAADELSEKGRKAGKRTLLLDNLTEIGQVSPEGRRLVVELAKTLKYDKLAMYGNSIVLRLAANLMLQAIGKRKKLKFFDDFDKAVEWLKK